MERRGRVLFTKDWRLDIVGGGRRGGKSEGRGEEGSWRRIERPERLCERCECCGVWRWLLSYFSHEVSQPSGGAGP